MARYSSKRQKTGQFDAISAKTMRIGAAFIAFLILCAAAQAQEMQTVTLHLDPASTTIHWTLGSLLHKAHGALQLKSGEVVVNPKTALSQGEILVDATTASSENPYDARWQKELFNSGTYPAILFHPNKIEGLKLIDGDQRLTASGTLTLRGQDHPIELPLAITIHGKDATITAHFAVPYVQWGLKQPGGIFGRYERQAFIDVSAHGQLSTQKTPLPQ
jgi:polyisoprenoid-binding protein YceI